MAAYWKKWLRSKFSPGGPNHDVAGTAFGFPPSQRSYLVGASDPSTSWLKEARLAEASGLESVVLFALDQICLIGYPLPLSTGLRRAVQFA